MNFEKSPHKKYSHLFDQIFDDVITVISILYIFFLIAELSYFGNTGSNTIMIVIDTIISFMFLFEFFYFFLKSDNKKEYLKYHCIDLFASVPYILLFSVSGLFFLLNFFKAIRGLKSIVKLYDFLFKTKLPLVLKIFILLIIIIMFFAIMIVQVEKGQNPDIQSFQDGIWWALVTIATVGYGDIVPVTLGGKILTFFLVFTGMGITSSIGALFALHLLKPSVENRYEKDVSEIKHGEKSIKKEEDTIKSQEELIGSMENRIISRLDKIEKKIKKKK